MAEQNEKNFLIISQSRSKKRSSCGEKNARERKIRREIRNDRIGSVRAKKIEAPANYHEKIEERKKNTSAAASKKNEKEEKDESAKSETVWSVEIGACISDKGGTKQQR